VLWHFTVHIMGVDYGLPYGRWSWYNFWSGIAGSFLVGAVVFAITFWWRSTCHHSWRCWRRGRYEAAGGMFKLCHRHHPDLRGQKPHRALIDRLHAEWKHGVS